MDLYQIDKNQSALSLIRRFEAELQEWKRKEIMSSRESSKTLKIKLVGMCVGKIELYTALIETLKAQLITED